MTAGTPRLSVVIPAYNEAARIGSTVADLRVHLPRVAPSWEIRVVDDGSTDDTGDIVQRAAREDPRVVLQREPHRGKGGTVRAGMLQAPGELRFMCDADLSMPLHELARFMAAVPETCDIAIGSREGPGARRLGEPAYRHVFGRVFNTMVRAGALAEIRDTQCGFKLFTRAAAQAVFPQITIDGWAFDIEALLIATRRGLRIREIPIEWHFHPQSRVSIVRDSLHMAAEVWRIRWNAITGKYDERH